VCKRRTASHCSAHCNTLQHTATQTLIAAPSENTEHDQKGFFLVTHTCQHDYFSRSTAQKVKSSWQAGACRLRRANKARASLFRSHPCTLLTCTYAHECTRARTCRHVLTRVDAIFIIVSYEKSPQRKGKGEVST